jgi:hypothetical protein
MKPTLKPTLWPLAATAAVFLSACGGGGGDSGDSGNNGMPTSASTAQGHAADATTMPVTASNTVDTSTKALQRALTAAVTGGSSAASRAACPLGGTISWSIEGGDANSRANGLLDAGETFRVGFANCATPSAVLNGNASFTVNAASATQLDLTSNYEALSSQTWQGRFVLTGSVRQQRSSSTSGGNTIETSRDTTPSLRLDSAMALRSASYELRNTDWTASRAFDSSGRIVSTSHQGTLTLVTKTARRPDATLTVVADGMSVGSEGMAGSGKLTVANERDQWSLTYAPGLVAFALDLGRDGRNDFAWTLDLQKFYGEAG